MQSIEIDAKMTLWWCIPSLQKKKKFKSTSDMEYSFLLSAFCIFPLTAEGAYMSASECLMLSEWNPPWSSTAEANIITYKVFSGSSPEVIEDSVMKGAIHLSIITWKQSDHMLAFLVEQNYLQNLTERYSSQTNRFLTNSVYFFFHYK